MQVKKKKNKKISIQYPLVELATAILFVLVYNFICPILTSYQYISVLYLFYISAVLIIIFVYDLKHYIIPDRILFPAIIISLIYNLIPPISGGDTMHQIIYSFLAAVIASGFFLIIFLLSKGKAMGFGDVKLAILMGFLLGFPSILVALFLAFLLGSIIGLLGSIIGVALMVIPARAGGEKKSLKSEIPFGPFLITGTFIAIFWGEQIIQWYLNFFKI
ncbi:MAG: A24 family peptidase [Candidatus Staskawiczbacteria bacterium]|nr:A24 family peptidase [Candidatus Staskawiczbacteria bacterium]